MRNLFILFIIGCISLPACKPKTTATGEKSDKTDSAYAKTGSVERLSPLMDDIISPGEVPEILAKGFEWSEGPVWIPDQDILLFSDVPKNIIYQWSEKGGLKSYLKPSGTTDTTSGKGEQGSNGLILDKNGRLVLCQHGDRRIARMDAPLDKPEPKFITIVDKWQGKRLSSPNDAVYNSKGDLFFTDPPYGLKHGFEDPQREIKFSGVFKLTAEGSLVLITDKLTGPNGIGLSPDESRLYVSNSGAGDEPVWMVFGIGKDGSVDKGKVFFDPKDSSEESGGDGLKVRKDGIIFATGPGGVWIFSPAGEHLGTIITGQSTANCALDDEENYLYITAHMYLMRIRLK